MMLRGWKILMFFALISISWADWAPTKFREDRIANRIVSLGNRVFANASGSGIFLSIDDGLNWTLMRPVPPMGGETVYGLAALLGKIYLSSDSGVYVSSDSGATFFRMSGLIDSRPAYSYAVYGSDIFAANRQVYRWNASATTWDSLGLLPSGIGIIGNLIAVDSILYAAADGGPNGGSVYALRLGSRIWRTLATGLNASVSSLILQYPFLYASNGIYGVRKMKIGDTAWDSVNTGLPLPAAAVSEVLAAGSFLYACTGQGVYWNADGINWRFGNQGIIPNSHNNTLGTNGRYIFASRGTGPPPYPTMFRRLISDFDTPVNLKQENSSFPNASIQVNRFSDELIFRYFLPEAGGIRFQIFTLSGRMISTLRLGQKGIGWHEFSWKNSKRVGDILVCRLEFKGQKQWAKSMLVPGF